MPTAVDFEVAGVTTFGSRPGDSFRYQLSLQDEKLNIWLEDRSNKKQWQSGLLSKAEYVTAANIFVDASAGDYVSCFQQSLDCSEDKTDESQRKLVPLRGGKLRLEMSIKLRLLQSARDVSYVFTLEPIAVERINILESKLKDQQEELEKLRAHRDNATRIFLYAESETWVSSTLQWKPVSSEFFALTADKTSITVLHPGLYAVGVLVNHLPTQASHGSISLQKNGVQLQRAATGASYYDDRYNASDCYDDRYNASDCNTSHPTSSSLMCI
ncbi:hypothetical protein PR003_g31224, partial [Phytophthora rubi]